MSKRTPLLAPLTQSQQLVVLLLGKGHNFKEIATYLHIHWRTVQFHAEAAAKKIPGDLRTSPKCIAWVRGASLAVLRGTHMKDDPKVLIRDMKTTRSHVTSLRTKRTTGSLT